MPPSSSSPVSSGGRANRRGRILERYVRELLERRIREWSPRPASSPCGRCCNRSSPSRWKRGREHLRQAAPRRLRSLPPAALARMSRHPVQVADLKRQRRREVPLRGREHRSRRVPDYHRPRWRWVQRGGATVAPRPTRQAQPHGRMQPGRHQPNAGSRQDMKWDADCPKHQRLVERGRTPALRYSSSQRNTCSRRP